VVLLNKKAVIILAGAVIGVTALILVRMGNPPNMGFCIACFLRDLTGGLGLQRSDTLQYIRPEIPGLVLGAFLASLFTREYRPLGGSSPLIRFVLAFFTMTGMLVFLGCPLRMLLRMAGGDLNALVGLFGLVAGVVLGIAFLRKGFSLGRATVLNRSNLYIFPAAAAALMVLLLARPAYFFFSQQGPASLHAPVYVSLAAGVLAGILAQRSRLCFVGGIRDFIIFRDLYLLYGFAAIFLTVLAGNLILGNFKIGFTGQPIAHSDGLWNFLGMALAGYGSVFLGGCPLRQLVSAAEGNTDSAVTVLGLAAGAAFAHNFGIAASAKGVPAEGKAAVLVGFAVIFLIALLNCKLALKKGVQAGGRTEGCAGSSVS